MPLPRKHILKNSATLLRLGVPVQDIERTSAWVESHLSANADPDTWLPSAADLQDDGVVSEAAVLDARLATYQNRAFPRRLRRLLDATGEA